MKHRNIFKDFEAGKITIRQAWEKFKKLPKPWTTLEWKKKRKIFLKTHCENCGSPENLLIQHPPNLNKFSNAKNQAYDTYMENNNHLGDLTQKDIDKYISTHSKVVANCDKCSKVLHSIFSGTVYSCQTCGIQFPADEVSFFSGIRTKRGYLPISHPIAQEKIKNAAIFEKKNAIYEVNKSKIEILSFELSYQQYEDYLSFKNVKTYCKKCAFIEDKNSGLIPN